MITTKLPEAVLVQLEIQKGSDRWTVDKLRDLLKSYIAAREAAEIQSKEKTNDFKPQQPSYANVQSRHKPSYGKPQNVRSSGEALFSATNDRPFTPTRTVVKKLCIYCKGSHWSDECRSKFGWIITGRTSEKSDGFEEPSMLILNYGTNSLPLLDSCAVTAIDKSMPIKPPLDNFWNIETIGISEPSEDSNNTKALEKINNAVEYTNERYLVCWPWKSELETLNDNKELAYGRYRSLLHRLRNKPELFENYDKIINEQCEKWIIEKVDVTNKHEDHITHYIPHHAVVDSTKPTTKVRIVYDASAKTRDDNKSLNNCLYRGPVMLKDLCGFLLRLRMFKYAVVADIEKAFLQLGLQNPDRNVTRFVWVKDRTMPLFNSNNVQIYRFCRVPFGVISSPFLLAATIDLHLLKYNTPVATKIQDNIYVDNLLTGVNTDDELKELYTESKSIFQEASMNLRNWCSNSAQFMSNIPKQDQANRERMKVLGITWTIKDDKLSMSGPK
ncbi:Hypothetical predicted protein [Mytilus galloprovincialis]|uniref:Reverse transcriptase domain-containing protein n=1 Tax=Mytilus galloprovincialis TaxID=29158 RepID=A0A8B6CX97_MYTGA|nr:Hypothetical predicted protein [Mytilus galloprovincialis]